MKKIFCLILLMILSFPSEGMSQDLFRANPADLSDAHSLFINPAVVQFQNFSFNTRWKAYQVGFVDDNLASLNSVFLSGCFPPNLVTMLPNVGIGTTIESFNTPTFRDVGIGLSFGYSLSPIVACGINAKAFNRFYNFDMKDVTHKNDPLFADLNTWNMSFGAGFFIRPVQNFSFGMSFNNINRPDLSLQNKGANQPTIFDFGIKYYYNIFGASIFSNYQQDEFTFGIIGEAKLFNKGVLKAGYHEHSILFEGQLKLYDGLSLVYRMEYPTYEISHYSYGSHQMGFSWSLKPPDNDYDHDIKASVDTVRVVKYRSNLIIDKAVADYITYLDKTDLKFPEEIEQKRRSSTSVSFNDDAGISFDDKAYENYRKQIQELFSTSKQTFNKKNPIDIFYHDKQSEVRAFLLKNFLVNDLGINENYIRIFERSGKSGISDSLKLLIAGKLDQNDDLDYIEIPLSPWQEKLVPNKVYFHISNADMKVHDWRILIRNLKGEVVRAINGLHSIPKMVEWDCFTNDGRLTDVGIYYYSFQYAIQSGQWFPKKPDRHRIIFIDETRDQTVHLTPNTPNNPDSVDIDIK